MHFTKMHGLGNDYLFVYGDVPPDAAGLAVRLSDRHFGVGSDGMIYITPSDAADFGMRIFNADGSEAAMCGNGIRCVGRYVCDRGLFPGTRLTIETKSGIRTLTVDREGTAVTVDMGIAAVKADLVLSLSAEAMAAPVSATPVSVGNLHAVIFTGDAEHAPLATLGAMLSRHEAFPDGVNVEFAQILEDGSIRMRVWERGSGITMACGTGACASAAAAVKKGLCRHDVPIPVRLDGGVLTVTVSRDFRVTMTGPAVAVFDGETV